MSLPELFKPIILFEQFDKYIRKPSGRLIESYKLNGLTVTVTYKDGVYYYNLIIPSPSRHIVKTIEKAYEKLILPEEQGLEEVSRQLPEPYRTLFRAEVKGLGLLEVLLGDKQIEDIQLISGKPVRIMHAKYSSMLSNIYVDEDYVSKIAESLQKHANRRLTLSRPFDSFVTEYDRTLIRVTMNLKSDITPNTSITIRKPTNKWTLPLFVKYGSLTPFSASILALSHLAKAPILVIGEMMTGKTSLVNSVISVTPPNKTIVVIEDAPEIIPPSTLTIIRHVPRVTGRFHVSTSELVFHSVRESAEYVIVGEVRDDKTARAWTEAILLGHGGLTTFHADNPRASIERLRVMGANEGAIETIRVVVHMKRVWDSREKRYRRIGEVYLHEKLGSFKQVSRVEDGELVDVFKDVEKTRWYEKIREGIGLDVEVGEVEKIIMEMVENNIIEPDSVNTFFTKKFNEVVLGVS